MGLKRERAEKTDGATRWKQKEPPTTGHPTHPPATAERPPQREAYRSHLIYAYRRHGEEKDLEDQDRALKWRSSSV